MSELQQHQELCRDFAVLLSYPDDQVKEQAAACVAHMKGVNSEVATSMESFLDFIETNDITRIEEAFTGTFDLQSLCHPYVGYQLCGESQQRTMFMLKLRELYKQYDFVSGNELPDHLAEVLRFVGSITDQDCRLEIIQDGILPALEKITQGIESDNHPYVALLNALQSFLTETATPDIERLPDDRQKECLS
ncbi:MAG: nitrate reductase molybdenum cofactor assembly chaperone [Deltaproteobacteria bacterium]|nr:nitrate reductase molybdenum cofactor assembly chaperone [Deltaproteobacteria bacterium]